MDEARKRPWREVTHIVRQAGPRGGECWFLTLECGHHRAVPIPPFRPEKANYSLRPEAPRKCRCWLCTEQTIPKEQSSGENQTTEEHR
jgi:transposase